MNSVCLEETFHTDLTDIVPLKEPQRNWPRVAFSEAHQAEREPTCVRRLCPPHAPPHRLHHQHLPRQAGLREVGSSPLFSHMG